MIVVSAIAHFFGSLRARGWLVLGAFVLIAIGAGYVGCLTHRVHEAEKEAKKAEKRAQEAISQDAQIEIRKSETEVEKIDENINAVKNSNLSNVSNDELRQRLIDAARKQK